MNKFENYLHVELDFDSPINLSQDEYSEYFEYLKDLILIRESERWIAEKRKSGDIGGPVHLAAGQEAIAVGISKFLNKEDFVFSAHRSHAHLLALNPNPYGLFAEVLGRATGLSRGFGGSMHLWNGQIGFSGSVPIVSGTIPLAVGAGLAAKLRKSNSIGVAYFGDGAMEEGVVHECLNIASKLEVPVLFACENNLFSSHLHINERQPSKYNSRFAIAHEVKSAIVDGNNMKNMIESSSSLIDYIRTTGKPAFLEAFTYRLYGHVDWREDIDVGVGRSKSDLLTWKSRDPIERLKIALSFKREFNSQLSKVEEDIYLIIAEAWTRAKADPIPEESELLKYVYNGF